MESISEAMNVPARILFGQTEGTTADEEALARYYRREARFLQQSAWRSSPLCRYGTRWRGVKIKKTFVPRYRNVLVGVGR
jgi:hypothetical protein